MIMINDPVGDLLARIRNALMRRHPAISVPYSRLKEDIAKLLIEEGYLSSVSVVEDKTVPSLKALQIGLKYDHDKLPIIAGMQRVSRPGQRIYSASDRIANVLSGYGVAVISTSRGLMTGRKARAEKIGGEILFKIW